MIYRRIDGWRHMRACMAEVQPRCWTLSVALAQGGPQPMKGQPMKRCRGETPSGEETYDGGDALPEGEGLLHHRDARGRHAGGSRGHEGREGKDLKHCAVTTILWCVE